MIERDYIMRMIDLLATVIARVLFLKKALDFPRAAEELAAASRNLLGLDPDVIRLMSDDQLIDLLSADEAQAAPKCYVLGMLLKEEAGLASMQGRLEDSASVLARSLSLLVESFLRSGGPVTPTHCASIEDVTGALRGMTLPVKVDERLFRYYELTGRYDKAEDTLFGLVDRGAVYIPAGLAFYARLLEKDDADLEHGNLSRTEIDEAVDDLRGREGLHNG